MTLFAVTVKDDLNLTLVETAMRAAAQQDGGGHGPQTREVTL